MYITTTTAIFKLSYSIQSKYSEFVEEMEARHIFLFHRIDINSSLGTDLDVGVFNISSDLKIIIHI
jgi:hypothetical protein